MKFSQLKKFIISAYYDLKKAYSNYFEYETNHHNIAAVTYANKAFASISAAEAFYYSNLDDLLNRDIENLFLLFNVSIEEIISSFAEEHSKQWSSIEFNKLEDALKSYSIIE